MAERSRSNWLTRSRLSARQLTLLVHLADKNSVLHAAEAANLTQPAASKALAQLEQALGVTLFIRHARGIEPTIYGDILVRHARSVLAQLLQAHEELEAVRLGLVGEVSVGTVVTSATTLIPHAIVALKEKFPGVQVNIDLDFSEVLVSRLLDQKLDMVVARLPDSVDANEVLFEPLMEDGHQIVVRAGHPLAVRKNLTLADLADKEWILPPKGNVMRRRIERLFAETGMEFPRHAVETPSFEVILGLLQCSDMIAPLSIDAARPFRDAGVLVFLDAELDLRLGSSGIVTLRDRHLTPASQAMLAALRHTAGIQRDL
ncbi:LysR family transcriptional regulator [Uliginosibacterium sp. sgz301328]|uniref:LysR family transcriptional regulator n=1 Tax=Uliginosibacterium sp. sgz301328 TaxID=3243764 RepID=UPI00359E96C4